MAGHDIFISYSKHDRARVEPMVAALEREGWTVYWDRRLVAGDAWHAQIAAALASARCVIVAWSAQSVVSNWVRDEATQALQRGVLVPVLIEPVAIPLGFGQVHTITVMDATGNLLPGAVPELCAGVRRHLGPGAAADVPPKRPSVSTPPAASSSAPAPRPRKPGRIARPLFPIVLPVLTVATMLGYIYNMDDAALAWLLVALGAGVAASVHRTMSRAWIDRFHFSTSLLSAMSIPAATVLAIVVALFLGPVMFRFLYGLMAGVLGAALAVAGVTQWWIAGAVMATVIGRALRAGLVHRPG